MEKMGQVTGKWHLTAIDPFVPAFSVLSMLPYHLSALGALRLLSARGPQWGGPGASVTKSPKRVIFRPWCLHRWNLISRDLPCILFIAIDNVGHTGDRFLPFLSNCAIILSYHEAYHVVGTWQ